MTTYYVDPTLGSDSDAGTSTGAPWKSLAKVAATTDFVAGDSILLKCDETFIGEYLTMPCDGSSDAYITFGNYDTGANPLLDGVRVYTDWASHAGSVYKRSDVSADISQVFEGDTRLTYKTASSDLVNGSYCYVSNVVYVQSLDGTDPNDHAVGYGRIDNGLAIKLNGKSHLIIDGIDFTKYNYGAINTDSTGTDDVIIRNCTASWSCREFLIGVTVAGVAKAPTNVTIEDCIGHDDLDVPFWIAGTNITVQRCEAYYNGKDVAPQAKNYPSASHFPDGIVIAGASTNCHVLNNYVHDNYLLPAIQDEYSMLSRSSGTIISGNRIDTSIGSTYAIQTAGQSTVISNNWINSGSGTAIILANTPVDTKIYNNTIISPSGAGHSFNSSNQNTTVDFTNNIVIRAGTTNRYVHVGPDYRAKFSCDANLYYGATTNRWYNGLAEYTTLATWQANIGGGDTGALNADPVFVVANTNPRLQRTSTAKNAGVDLSATFTVDYDGNTRGAAFDMGAFEYPVMVVNNATQSQIVDNVTLTAHDPAAIALVIANATQAQTVDNVVLTGHVPTYSLTVADATQSQTVTNLTLTGHIPTYSLTVADATQAQTVDNVTLTYHAPGAVPLTVQNATQSQTVDNITLTGHVPTFSLTVADATQAQTVENVTLTGHIPTYALTVNDATQGQVADNVTLVWHPVVVPPVTPTGGVMLPSRLQYRRDNIVREDELVLMLLAKYLEVEESEYAN